MDIASTPAPKRSLSLLDASLLVIGSMIGSGIFIVSADIMRSVGSAGWLIVVWLLSGFLTMAAALSYGELSGMFPKAGGQYVYLKEAYGKLYGFLYGWAFFAVIQTGTIAAVGVAFGKFLGYLVPELGDAHILFSYGPFTISAAQIIAIGLIFLLTAINTRGVQAGKWIQFVFTTAKVLAIAALVIFGFTLFHGNAIWHSNWQQAWQAKTIVKQTGDIINHQSLVPSALMIAIVSGMVGALFSSDAWNSVTFIAGEVKRPERNIGLSLFIGTLVVTILYVSINLMYLYVLPVHDIALKDSVVNPNTLQVINRDRVALMASINIFGVVGTTIIAVLVMVSTFGCNNGLILSGARVYNTMAKDGLFLPAAKKLNRNGVPGPALWMQCLWASLLCLSGRYSQLLDYVVFTVLLFYILTLAGIFILRKKQPDLPRPYKAFGYPVLPILYIMIASFICIVLLVTKTNTTWPGLLITLIGIPIYLLINRKNNAAANA